MTREALIINKAQDLLRRFPQATEWTDVEAIARGLGLEIHRGDLGSETSGLIYREGGRTIIAVNSTQHPLRQRFTIAHECGHYELHRDKDLWVDSAVMFRSDKTPKDARELEANKFAAELLMPRALIADDLIGGIGDIATTIPRLAKKYRVSTEAMTNRLVNLRLIPVC